MTAVNALVGCRSKRHVAGQVQQHCPEVEWLASYAVLGHAIEWMCSGDGERALEQMRAAGAVMSGSA